MDRGRPTKYRPEYCEQVIELGRLGKSPAQIAAALDVARATLTNWAEDHPDFLAALTRAYDLSQAWFEDRGQEGLTAPGFNANLWAKQVSSRFADDYTSKSKTEVTGPNGSPLGPAVIVIPPDMSPSDAARAYQDIIDRA